MYKTFYPCKQLEQYVAFIYIMEKEVNDVMRQTPEFLLPSGTPIIGLHYEGNWFLEHVKNESFPSQVLPNFYVAGQQTTSYTLKLNNIKTGIIGVALKPRALWQLFKIPMHTLTNNVNFLQDIIPQSNQLIEQFKTAKTHNDKINKIETFLIDLTENLQIKPNLIDNCLEAIFKTKGCITIKELIKISGLSERTLQMQFREQVGISPMQYARIIRFNNLFVEISKPKNDIDLLFLASVYNYYDTSHLYKDFIKYIGIAPTSFSLDKFKLLEELIVEIPYLIQVQN